MANIGIAELAIILLACLLAIAVVGGIGFLIFSRMRSKQPYRVWRSARIAVAD